MVKICGVRDAAGLRACVVAEVDLVGLNFVKASKRYIAPERARELLASVDGAAAPGWVGVFRDAPADEVVDIAGTLGLGWVQLHGDEPTSMLDRLQPRFRVIRALRADAPDLAAQVAAWERAELLLLDAAVPGAGVAWDPALLRGLKIDRPWLLAGGLTPGNVASLVEATGARGVDVASGVERNGAQDPGLVELFCRAARAALQATPP